MIGDVDGLDSYIVSFMFITCSDHALGWAEGANPRGSPFPAIWDEFGCPDNRVSCLGPRCCTTADNRTWAAC